MLKEKNKKGGYRQGAGRKKTFTGETVKLKQAIPVETKELLADYAKKQGKTQNEVLNDILLEKLSPKKQLSKNLLNDFNINNPDEEINETLIYLDCALKGLAKHYNFQDMLIRAVKEKIKKMSETEKVSEEDKNMFSSYVVKLLDYQKPLKYIEDEAKKLNTLTLAEDLMKKYSEKQLKSFVIPFILYVTGSKIIKTPVKIDSMGESKIGNSFELKSDKIAQYDNFEKLLSGETTQAINEILNSLGIFLFLRVDSLLKNDETDIWRLFYASEFELITSELNIKPPEGYCINCRKKIDEAHNKKYCDDKCGEKYRKFLDYHKTHSASDKWAAIERKLC